MSDDLGLLQLEAKGAAESGEDDENPSQDACSDGECDSHGEDNDVNDEIKADLSGAEDDDDDEDEEETKDSNQSPSKATESRSPSTSPSKSPSSTATKTSKAARLRKTPLINYAPSFDMLMTDLNMKNPDICEINSAAFEPSIRQLLRDRGFAKEKVAEMVITPSKSPSFFIKKSGFAARPVAIFFITDMKVSVSVPRKISRVMEDFADDVDVLILLNAEPKSVARREFESLNRNTHRMLLSEIRKPITKHHLVPRHTRLPHGLPASAKMDRKKLRKYLEVLDIEDVVSRWMGYNIGDIIQIERKFGGYMMPQITWRIVDRTISSV